MWYLLYVYIFISTSFSFWILFCMMSDSGLSGMLGAALFCCGCCCCCWWRCWWSLLATIGRTSARVCGILDWALISASCPRRVSEAVLDNLTTGFFGAIPAFPVEFRVASPRCNSEVLFIGIFVMIHLSWHFFLLRCFWYSRITMSCICDDY